MSRGSVPAWRVVAGSLVLGVAYVAAAQAQYPLPGGIDNHLPLWLPTGVALGALLLGGWRLVGGVAAGVVAVVLLQGGSWRDAGLMVGPVAAQALFGWWLLTRVYPMDRPLERVRDVLVLVGLGAGISTLVAPATGVLLLGLVHGLPWPETIAFCSRWWLAASLGVLLATPAILAWGSRPSRRWRRREWANAGVVALLLVLCGAAAFVVESANIFVMAPPLVLAALRLGQRGTTLASLAVGLWSVIATSRGQGPLVRGAAEGVMGDLQAFVVVMGLMAMLLAASLAERAQTRAALQQGDERFRALAEGSPDVIMRFDRDHRHLYVNPAVEPQTGFKVHEFLHRTHHQMGFPEPLVRVWEAALDTVFASGESHRIEFELPSGVWIDWMLAPERDEHGEVAFVTAVARDITARKRFEAELEQRVAARTIELEHANNALRESQRAHAVGQLAGGIAHDFNNLLQALVGGVEAIRQRGDDAEIRRKLAEEMSADIRRGAALTRQLLLFVRQQVTCMQKQDLCEVVEEAAALLRRLLRENIALVVTTGGEPLSVEADRSQLEQVLVNLTLNAADAIDEDGRIDIRAGADGATSVFLEVTDTGEGIEPALHERIFEPFFTTKEGARGTGLGLAVVRSIAIQHGGRVELESAPGRGSTFRIVLPRRPASGEHAAVALDETASASGQPLGGSVLLVEDEPSARDGLAAMLEMLGCQVLAVGSAEEALGVEDDRSFDLLLTDLLLPGMHGGELIRRARARWPEIKVLVMSGYAEDEAVRRGVLDGKVIFLQKPFGAAVLERELRSALGLTPHPGR